MPEPANYKLADLLGIAGATIGIIIAGAILLQCFVTKYIAIFERYRGLTGEYRSNNFSDPRKDSLQNQITSYRRQVVLLNFGSLFVAVALLLFLVTVAVASLSVVFPKELSLRAIGTGTLFTGLLLVGIAVTLQLRELWLSRGAISGEVTDFADIPKQYSHK